jgi:Mannosyl-glycoprotein endo-beta-N-acetylglucosaminidase
LPVAYRLVPHGAAGLACDDDGVALGPMRLVDSATDAAGRRRYRLRPASEIAEALRLAYGSASKQIERCQRGFARIAQLLSAGERAQACIRAVQLAFPEIAPDGMAKLAHAASLQKYNPNWEQEPRIPGGPGGGDWTNDGGGSDANIRPVAAPLNPVQAKKERFVDAHLADTQKVADRLGVPVENILGAAALESNWGASRIAIQGNNFFGINYPAPHAVGPLPAPPGGTTIYSKFPSYADSLKSFVAIAGSLVQGKSDPAAFAAALQNSGKFGVYKNGAKVPTYVPEVAATIRGLSEIVGRRTP